VIYGFGQFLEGALERKWLPALAAVKRQAIGTSAERSQTKSRICPVLIGAPNDQVASPRGDV
jgi:hypothetical protein